MICDCGFVGIYREKPLIRIKAKIQYKVGSRMERTQLQKVQRDCETVRSELEKSEERLRFFKHEIGQESGRIKELHAQVKPLNLKKNYFIIASKYRMFWSKLHIWKGGTLFVIPPAIALMFFIFFDMLTGFRSVAWVASAIVLILVIVALWVLPRYPSDHELSYKISQTKKDLSRISENVTERKKRIEELNQGLEKEVSQNASLKHQLRELEKISSITYYCQQLFDENWRAMRSVEFELYLERVFKLLGYNTETTNTTGDQGVDLIVEKAGRRTAIQVKGYLNSVSNSAIQEAFAGMRHYNCHSCAVITNSRFTQSAIDLATSTNCFLIHEDNFREFVFGELVIY